MKLPRGLVSSLKVHNISVVAVVLGAYAYYECDLYKHYEVYGATLLGVTAVLNKIGYKEQGGKLYK